MCLIRHFLFAFALIQLHFLVSDANTLDAEVSDAQWNKGQTGTVTLDYPGQTLYYYVENHGGTDDFGENQDMTVKLCYDDGTCINECSTRYSSGDCVGSTCIDNDNPDSFCASSDYSKCSPKACSGTVQNLPIGTTTLSYKCDQSFRDDTTCHFKLILKTTYASPPPPSPSPPPPPSPSPPPSSPPPPISSSPPTTTTTTPSSGITLTGLLGLISAIVVAFVLL